MSDRYRATPHNHTHTHPAHERTTVNPLRIGSLCSGYRGLDMAVETVFDATTAWVSDGDPGANKILAHHWPTVPNLGDLTTTRWDDVEPVDIVCGGYPCQPFSTAGLRKGTQDERHIWPYIADALRVLRPRYAVFENVAGHLRLGFDTVLADLARLGFDAEWCLVRASEVGAPHQRNRLFLLAVAADAPAPDEGRLLGGGSATESAGRTEPGNGGRVAADAADLGHERGRGTRDGRPGSADHGVSAADAASLGRGEGRAESARQQGRPGAASGSGATAAHPNGRGLTRHQERDGGPTDGQPERAPRVDADRCGLQRAAAADWGRFGPAILRWEAVTGRRAPWATDVRNRLSPAFVEWLMGLPAGHVTAVPDLTRTQQLKALGNGVVPQQAAAAIRLLTDRTAAAPTAPAA